MSLLGTGELWPTTMSIRGFADPRVGPPQTRRACVGQCRIEHCSKTWGAYLARYCNSQTAHITAQPLCTLTYKSCFCIMHGPGISFGPEIITKYPNRDNGDRISHLPILHSNNIPDVRLNPYRVFRAKQAESFFFFGICMRRFLCIANIPIPV
jgi:hypothetical protein